MLNYAQGIHLVRAFQIDDSGGPPMKRLWVAAVPREEAQVAVQRGLPDGWRAELAPERLTTDAVRRLRLRAGEVRELSA